MYNDGDKVWLKAFENEPRQRGIILGPEYKGTYVVLIDEDLHDVPSDQIEGLVNE